MSIESDKERLSQGKALEDLRRQFTPNEMVTAYQLDYRHATDGYDHYIKCVFIPSNRIGEALDGAYRNMFTEELMPGTTTEDGNVKYSRYGHEYIEPLVIPRYFNGMRECYVEISEEFRHFHELYYDRKNDQYLKFDDDGEEWVVATVKPRFVQIQLKEIRQFLSIKEMHLMVLFDHREYSQYTLKQMGLAKGSHANRNDFMRWDLHYDHGSIRGSLSMLRGFRLFAPLPKSKSGFFDFAERLEQKYVDFIIGVDESGDDIECTAGPRKMDSPGFPNPEAPEYLTPVSFRREVLNKYYASAKYKIADGNLQCAGLWSMPIDDDHDDKVVAYLGDLGRKLPYKEQLHWKSHNISSPSGISKTAHRRDFLAEMAESNRPEHIFRQRYEELAEVSQEHLGWHIILPLHEGDKHHLHRIRVPATDEQGDFDDLVLGLTKIIIDSLNMRKMSELISPEHTGSAKGIAILESTLSAYGITNSTDHISFLKALQSLRSASAAHRKGDNYRKISNKLGLDNQNMRSVFAEILKRTTSFLEYLIEIVKDGSLSNKPFSPPADG